jgi:uncharacterized protein (TIGR02145 family)
MSTRKEDLMNGYPIFKNYYFLYTLFGQNKRYLNFMKSLVRLTCLVFIILISILYSCKKEDLLIKDIDGNVYHTVTIGSQVWMKENLNTTRYRNGDLIGTTSPATLDLTNENAPEYQWAYDSSESNATAYGRLYTWYTVADSRKICPADWHVPSDEDWKALTTYLGTDYFYWGGKLKETGTTHWRSPNEGATNESGFTGLPGGERFYKGRFEVIGDMGFWWSATESDSENAFYRGLQYISPNLIGVVYKKRDGYSVRCIKD